MRDRLSTYQMATKETLSTTRMSHITGEHINYRVTELLMKIQNMEKIETKSSKRISSLGNQFQIYY